MNILVLNGSPKGKMLAMYLMGTMTDGMLMPYNKVPDQARKEQN